MNATSPARAARTWSCELDLRLKTWKRTAGTARKNTKEYKAHKAMLREYFGIKRMPRWGQVWLRLEVHVFLSTMASHGDWDNYGKVISDALQSDRRFVGLFSDDRMILDGRVIKHIDSGEERVLVCARELDCITDVSSPPVPSPWRHDELVAHGLYRHYKTGDEYRALDAGIVLESTGEYLVIYQNIDTHERYARPAREFTELIEGAPRFELISRSVKE